MVLKARGDQKRVVVRSFARRLDHLCLLKSPPFHKKHFGLMCFTALFFTMLSLRYCLLLRRTYSTTTATTDADHTMDQLPLPPRCANANTMLVRGTYESLARKEGGEGTPATNHLGDHTGRHFAEDVSIHCQEARRIRRRGGMTDPRRWRWGRSLGEA